ncbi:MAG: type II toxin-antitoxin system VapC family toxin [Desulfohalobiaceae bacterium]|nr:type II toxin-antitoxin system VapC family toxin [Desulfohalobiaceae bacterium]
MAYMLDTNICIAIMKGHTGLRSKLHMIRPDEISISSIVQAELCYGVWKSVHRAHNEQALADFLAICRVLAWPGDAADTYGEIRSTLEMQGRIIGANDLLIAAHAKYLDVVLVTNNVREFKRIPALDVENWISPS